LKGRYSSVRRCNLSHCWKFQLVKPKRVILYNTPWKCHSVEQLTFITCFWVFWASNLILEKGKWQSYFCELSGEHQESWRHVFGYQKLNFSWYYIPTLICRLWGLWVGFVCMIKTRYWKDVMIADFERNDMITLWRHVFVLVLMDPV